MITKFYAYRPDGEIVLSGMCPDDQIQYQSFPDASIAIGDAEVGKHYRADDGSIVELPPKPSPYHKFDYSIRQWVADVDAAWAAVRTERDKKLKDSDWTQLPDVPLITTIKEAWAVYRQALRDVPQQQSDPFNIVWPEPPQ